MADANVATMNAEELEQYGRGFGDFLARLLHASQLSPDQKAAWAVLVTDMTLDQMVRFAAVLELYTEAPKADEVAELKKKLQAIKDEYDAKITELGNTAQNELASVMADFKAAEEAA